MELSDFGARIKQLRTRAGMTQREMAKKIGVTATSLSAYENGTQTPSISVALSIADLFHVKIDWLCFRAKDPSVFSPDEYCKVDLVDFLDSFDHVLDMPDIIILDIVRDDDGFESVELEIKDSQLESFLIDSKKLLELFQNGSLSLDMYKLCREELISKTAKIITMHLRELNDPNYTPDSDDGTFL